MGSVSTIEGSLKAHRTCQMEKETRGNAIHFIKWFDHSWTPSVQCLIHHSVFLGASPLLLSAYPSNEEEVNKRFIIIAKEHVP